MYYTLQEFKDRHTPQNWDIISNEEGILTAKNNVSNEQFSGTIQEFKTLVNRFAPSDIMPIYNEDGVFVGFRTNLGDVLLGTPS
jgi:hypothetical protein